MAATPEALLGEDVEEVGAKVPATAICSGRLVAPAIRRRARARRRQWCLGLGLALAEATGRESERVQGRRREEFARDPLIHPRTVLGRSTAREGSSASMASVG